MNKKLILEKTAEFVKKELHGESTGHDWWHIHRVWETAIKIGEEEKADLFVVQLAALLHDIDDWKMHKGDDSVGPKRVKEFLEKLGVEPKIVSEVVEIISTLSFKSPTTASKMITIEGKVVQDADRLDALGAIGIARCFSGGQKFGQTIYDPDIKPQLNMSPEDYKKQYTGERKNTSVNHFYEKLLLLKDQMNTKTGKLIAEQRHKFMENFLERFYKECEGEE
ncbi:MAG: HD domain-containing protein [Candidatus Aenigmarchaeota archaeon]|nr:HD domain-containing protein [Candidatus Aenigmarchaeota archaeon]